jgi:hypothetical protein
VGGASSVSRAYSTACSKGIAWPSAHAVRLCQSLIQDPRALITKSAAIEDRAKPVTSPGRSYSFSPLVIWPKRRVCEGFGHSFCFVRASAALARAV